MSEDWRGPTPNGRTRTIRFRAHPDEVRAFKKLARRKKVRLSEVIRWMLYKTFPPDKW